MASLTQTMQWLAAGVVGKIPVWNSAGYEVGYRDSYDSMVVHFNASYKGETALASKDFYGNDIKLNLPSSPIPVGNPATVQSGQGSSVIPATSQIYSAVPATVSTGVSGIIDTVVKYKVPIIIGAGAVCVLWLVMGARR